jgi:oligoendopeptidase F
MRRYDLYAPLAHEKNDYSYDFAVKKVLNTFQQFSPEFHRRANEIIQQQHIHSLLQKNKQSGAYCSTPSVKTAPFVFLNYTGTIRDISTLAHELGHGIHSLLAKNNTEFTQHACLPLAETASIFSEMLLSEQLLQEDPKRSEDIIFLKMDNLYASIIRQAGFVEFEIKAHQLLREGKTIDDISRIYLKDLKDQLGPHIKVDDNFAYEWCLIPHIYHTPFYCYAYAFGNLLSLALYNIYREKGSRFTPLLIEFLSKGGSESPVDLLNRLGIDPCSESFWQNGFDHIENMIKKVE